MRWSVKLRFPGGKPGGRLVDGGGAVHDVIGNPAVGVDGMQRPAPRGRLEVTGQVEGPAMLPGNR